MNLDLFSVLIGVMIGYAIFSIFGLVKATKDKKAAQKELNRINEEIGQISQDLDKKKDKLTSEISRTFGVGKK